jgi:aminomethyltransferase
VTNGGFDFIPLIPKRDPQAAGAPPDLGIRTNTLALAHLYMQQGWHPAPVHSFTLPLWFGGLYDEQRAARQDAAIFDRSHLGRFYVTGERASEVLRRVFARDVDAIPPLAMRRALLLREDATILDIVTICHLDAGRWLVVTGPQTQRHLPDIVQAAIDDAGLADEVLLRDRLTESVQLSVQGPRAAELLEGVVGTTIPGAVPEGEAHELLLGGYRALVAHTSQIAEDGYWFIVSPEVGEHFWENSVAAGIVPAGLAAHDALRIEAGVLEAPYETPVPVTPLSAGLAHLIDRDDDAFVGGPAWHALVASAVPPERVVRAVRLTGRGLARRGARVRVAVDDVGALVNAAYSAHLDASIGVAYLPPHLTRVEVEVDAAFVPAEVSDPPLVPPPAGRVTEV